MTHRRPLIVRLRNFIGDVVLMIPALERLERAGYELHCVGKGWAKSLLDGHGWSVETYPKSFAERVAVLKALRERLNLRTPQSEINAITFATSFSSALDMRVAGLKPFGYAVEARSLLLTRGAKIVYGEHAMHSYWRLAGALLNASDPPPASVSLKISESARREADAALRDANVADRYIVIVPFAGGTFEKLDKKWPEFDRFVADQLSTLGYDLVIAPGPDEVDAARTRFPTAKRLENLKIGPYAEVLRRAALTISNDTGPGHIAASVGGRLLSVLGPTKVEQWGALGPTVTIVHSYPEWPRAEEVLAKTQAVLSSVSPLRRVE